MAPFTLTETELVADPETVFRLLEKIGEGCVRGPEARTAPAEAHEATRVRACCGLRIGRVAPRRPRHSSYGYVHRAVHIRTSTVVAIKIVPIENDIEEIVREVTVMNGLDSEFIVNLFGSYLKETNLWVRWPCPNARHARAHAHARPRVRLLGLTSKGAGDGANQCHGPRPTR